MRLDEVAIRFRQFRAILDESAADEVLDSAVESHTVDRAVVLCATAEDANPIRTATAAPAVVLNFILFISPPVGYDFCPIAESLLPCAGEELADDMPVYVALRDPLAQP
jgi:hypothetical protein